MKHIKCIIDDHIKSYGIRENIPQKALRILFNQGLYDECIWEILKHYNLPVKLRVVKGSVKGSVAHIGIPEPMPIYPSEAFKNYRFVLTYDKENSLSSFERFIFTTAHEIGHILLFGTCNTHKRSEKATDLIAMVMGYDIFYKEFREQIIVYKESFYNVVTASHSGYLTDEETRFALTYLRRIRRYTKWKQFFTKIKNRFFK